MLQKHVQSMNMLLFYSDYTMIQSVVYACIKTYTQTP
jgi:hypothetical protein